MAALTTGKRAASHVPITLLVCIARVISAVVQFIHLSQIPRGRKIEINERKCPRLYDKQMPNSTRTPWLHSAVTSRHNYTTFIVEFGSANGSQAATAYRYEYRLFCCTH